MTAKSQKNVIYNTVSPSLHAEGVCRYGGSFPWYEYARRSFRSYYRRRPVRGFARLPLHTLSTLPNWHGNRECEISLHKREALLASEDLIGNSKPRGVGALAII